MSATLAPAAPSTRRRRPEHWLARRGGAVELLRAPALAYAAIVELRGRLYDGGLLPVARVDAPVVSVGNLTAGGTGKTPMVVWVVRALQARGLAPGVLSRGYRGDGEPNDEARMLAELLPGVPLEQDPDRIAGAERLLQRGVDAIVLDDGFQHRRLHRDVDLVLVDATRPWGLPPPPEGGEPVCALLPRGLLRERTRALERAHALVLTRADQVEPRALEALEAKLTEIAPAVPLCRARHKPRLLRAPDGSALLPSALRGREVDLVSGIGNPDAFEASVRALGGRPRTHRRFPDHHRFEPEDFDGLGGGARDGAAAERWIVTTAKDAARLPAGRRAHVLEVELEVQEGASVLEALLGALPVARARRERMSLHEGLHG